MADSTCSKIAPDAFLFLTVQIQRNGERKEAFGNKNGETEYINKKTVSAFVSFPSQEEAVFSSIQWTVYTVLRQAQIQSPYPEASYEQHWLRYSQTVFTAATGP